MNRNVGQNALSQYRQVAVHSSVDFASPHRLIQMLMEGALDKIAAARGFIEQRDIPNKSRHISWAMSIISGLRGSLDHQLEGAGELVKNLDGLYTYMNDRLLDANLNNDLAALEEVSLLMKKVKSGWDGLPEDAKQGRQIKAVSHGAA